MPTLPKTYLQRLREQQPQRSTFSAKRHDAERPNAASRGYDARWNKLRAAYALRHPLCCVCLEPMEIVDHVVPIAEGGDRLAWDNLQSLCRKHHAAKTAADQRKYRGQ
jgi:5-methylcytosine-specific restriction protein A